MAYFELNFSQLRRKRREHLIEDLKMRKERKQELENRTSQSSLDEYRPLKSRGMALRLLFVKTLVTDFDSK